jgi:hypothetical protein
MLVALALCTCGIINLEPIEVNIVTSGLNQELQNEYSAI